MSYEVTATRRRPQRFEDLAGQEFVAETLKNSIKSGKIAHAYLFSGPRGCGKTSTARILAKALNCEKGPAADPCGTCTHCQEITKGSSLDVIEIDGASNTSVNDIRQIKDEVMFPPNSSRYKIYIIDEVHMLSTSAFNALLKTIEEPPPYVIFIFATTELQKVPATIKSRCQQFKFRLVPVEQEKALLAAAAKELNIQADDEALYWIARESTGSARDSYTLFDQIASFSDGHITYEKIRDKLGLVGVDRLNELFNACAEGSTQKCLESLDTYLQSGIAIEQLISNSADYIRSLLLIKNGIRKEALLGNAPERYSSVVLGAWNTIQIERALSIFLNLYRDIRYSLSPRYELELAFSRLCWLSQYVSPAEVKKAIDAAHSLLTEVPVLPERHPAAPEVPRPVEKHIPAGMPHFSALDDMHAQSQQEQQCTDPPPFPDGGALPPQNTVAAAEAQIPAGSNNNDWANTDIPPESEYAPDDDTVSDDDTALEDNQVETTTVESGYETVVGSTEPAAPVQQVEPAQTYTTAEGRTITISQIRGSVIADLSINDPMTASALMQTGQWELDGNTVSTGITSSYQNALLQQKATVITTALSKICGRNILFSVSLKEAEPHIDPADIPVPVKVLCNVFKGSIEGGKK